MAGSATRTGKAAAAPAITMPRLPAGFHASRVWLNEHGERIVGDVGEELIINSETLRPAGQLWLCPKISLGCGIGEWTIITDTDAAGEPLVPQPKLIYCPQHGDTLTRQDINASASAPVAVAASAMGGRLQAAIERRRKAALAAATGRMLAAQQAVTDAGRRTGEDYQRHLPSLVASTTALTAGIAVVELGDPLAVAAAGLAFAVGGGLFAYAATFVVQWQRARRRGARRSDRLAKALAQSDARYIGSGVAATGAWTATAGGLHLGANPTEISGLVALGAAILLTWIVNHGRWSAWTAERRAERNAAAQAAAEAARLAGEEAARHAAALLAVPEEPPPAIDPEDPLAAGEQMAAEWRRISDLADARQRFPVMHRTRILPALTRAVSAPIDGEEVRIGWEFVIDADPGVLVPAIGAMESPLKAARLWLAAVMGVDQNWVSAVDRPDGDVNRALLVVTKGSPLGGTVDYLGAAGIERRPDGSIWGHDGRDLRGKLTYEALYIPGQPFGGAVYGTTGGGKSQALRGKILNFLYGGIFPVIYDPKNFVDYSEFAGIVPMGCTIEHRDIILRALYAEMARRQQMLSQLVGKDRHGRVRPIEGAWRIERDGPPLASIWDEFHLHATDKKFIGTMTPLVRLQRATASGVLIGTQGGGLADTGDSVLRSLINATAMEIFRMSMQQARLTGYTGDYNPAGLPRVPGMLITTSDDGPVVPKRRAFITREDVDGSVYDHLYAPDGSQILFPPALPPETHEVFKAHGLIDLWEAGKGPNGLANLQSAEVGSIVIPADAALAATPADGPKIDARDVILAAMARGQIGARTEIDDHPIWREAPGWGEPPAPSTITRAVGLLMSDGLVLNEVPGHWRALTTQGVAAAERALAVLEIATGRRTPDSDAAAPGLESVADKERRIDAELEQDRIIRDSLATAAEQ